MSGAPKHPLDHRYEIADLSIAPARRLAWRHGKALALRPADFDLLVQLARQSGRILPRDALLAALWPNQPDAAARLTTHFHHLRRIVDVGGALPLLHTITGQGYLLSAEPPAGTRRVRRAKPERRLSLGKTEFFRSCRT